MSVTDETAVPIMDPSGNLIPLNSGFIAVGTFPGNVDPASIEDIRAFKIFGEGDTSINNSIGLGGFVTGTRSAPIPEGTIDSPVNESVYVVIGDGVDLASSGSFAVYEAGYVFGTDPGELEIIIDSDTLIPERLIFGSILYDVDIGIGLLFNKVILMEGLSCVGNPEINLNYSITNGSATITGADQFETIRGLAFPETIEGNPVTAIGDEAFMLSEENDGRLFCVNIPDSVTSIGGLAFYQNYALRSVTIGNGVKSIGGSAFSHCYTLESIKIGNNVTTIGGGAFSVCRSLESITIPDTVESIGDSAFWQSGLKSITIGNGVTSIGDYAFHADYLTSITVGSENTSYSDIDGVLYNKEKTSLLVYPQARGGTNYTIPSEVTSIAAYAFFSNQEVQSVTMPDNVTRIERNTFADCRNLETITIGKGVNEISKETFSGCTGLTSIIFKGSAPNVAPSAFWNVSKNASIYVTPEALDSFSSIDGRWNDFAIQVGDGPGPAESPVTIRAAVELSFYTLLGTSYKIEESFDLINWRIIEFNIPGSGGRIDRFYSTRHQPNRHFRVSVSKGGPILRATPTTE